MAVISYINRATNHRDQLKQTLVCGCYYCLQHYSPTLIKKWTDGGTTGLCAKCGVDAVIPYDTQLDVSIAKLMTKLAEYRKEMFSDTVGSIVTTYRQDENPDKIVVIQYTNEGLITYTQ